MIPPLKPGVLVVLEGIDGAGKSTAARNLAARLRADGLSVRQSREPTDGPWGTLIRASATEGRREPAEEAELFRRDRAQHVQEVIGPALAAGQVVLLDRYYFSTMAYQGARGLDPEALRVAHEAIAPRPDLLCVLDLDPDQGMSRVTHRGAADLFEDAAMLRASRSIFLNQRQPFAVHVDALLPEAPLAELLRERVWLGPLLTRLGLDAWAACCPLDLSGVDLSEARRQPDPILAVRSALAWHQRPGVRFDGAAGGAA